MSALSPSQIAQHNTRQFIVYRVLFSARFYYPVFAIIFLDFGLSLEQFVLLNVIWAVTIILAEVPSGALSDLVGRRKLLIFTASLMVAEMLVWALAPTSNMTLLFWVLAFNRVLSGLGEAAASGSDEALVFDSLENAGLESSWSSVLERVTRYQSIGFMVAMIIGGAIYDPSVVQGVTDMFGMQMQVTQETTVRWPIYLNVLTAFALLFVAFRFIEPNAVAVGGESKVKRAFQQTFAAGKWIMATPFALLVIIAGAFLDSVIRMFMTMNSEYFRLIEFTPVMFGFIGSALAALNILVASMSKRLVDQRTPQFNFFLVSCIAFVGFVGSSFFIPYFGLAFVVLIYIAIFITTFSLSYYLNHIANRDIRATVLSFKGLALNAGYGLIGLFYSLLVAVLARGGETPVGEDIVFKQSIAYFPVYIAIGVVAIIGLARWLCPQNTKSYEQLCERCSAEKN